MGGPGAFSEIGKKAKDLIFKDYSYDQKFTIKSKTASGVSFETSGTQKGEEFFSDLKTELKHGNIETEFKVDSKSKVHTKIQYDDVAPGLDATLKGTFPDAKSGKAELKYKRDALHSTASVSLVSNPLVETTVAVGAHGVVAGAEIAYDTAASAATKYNFALGLKKDDYALALILADKTDTLKLSVFHELSKKSSVAVEVAHRFSKSETTFTAGALHRLDPLTTAKSRVNNRGTIAALLTHEFRPKSTLTLSGEVDSKALDKGAKMGLSLSLKP